MPVRSARNSSLPALNSLIALAMSNVTVPPLGDGINPRGPNNFPSFATCGITSGVAISLSKSIMPF